MKKLFLIIFLLILSCNLTNTKSSYKAFWKPNPASDNVTQYNVFVIEVVDTSLSKLKENIDPDLVRKYQIGSTSDTEYVFESYNNGLYLQVGCVAVSGMSEGDSLSVSNFFKKPVKYEKQILPYKLFVKK